MGVVSHDYKLVRFILYTYDLIFVIVNFYVGYNTKISCHYKFLCNI